MGLPPAGLMVVLKVDCWVVGLAVTMAGVKAVLMVGLMEPQMVDSMAERSVAWRADC